MSKDAFKPKSVTEEVCGIPVAARSMSTREVFAHRDMVAAGDKIAVMANLVATCICEPDTGEQMFKDGADALECDQEAFEGLLTLAAKVNGINLPTVKGDAPEDDNGADPIDEQS